MVETPLQIARNKKKGAKCISCKSRTIINGVNYCEVSGKFILSMHLESDRSTQCKETFESEDK